MTSGTRLVGFGAALGVAFGAAALTGAATDPSGSTAPAEPVHGRGVAHGVASGGKASDHGGAHNRGGPAASGLAVSDSGYALEAERTFLPARNPERFVFRIRDQRGRVVRDGYELEAEREMHLIVVRRDTATYEHLHPRRSQEGTWSVDLELPEPGVYRAYADFKIDGRQRTLATDLFVPGDFRPRQLPAPRSSDATGGFEVGLDARSPRAGRESELTFTVTDDGRPVTALEPYLGAKGHLVALREGDLAYLHVHPTDAGGQTGPSGATAPHEEAEPGSHSHGASGGAGDGEVRFAATFPTPGRYRLFLQFQTAGQVRTVDYTLEVTR